MLLLPGGALFSAAWYLHSCSIADGQKHLGAAIGLREYIHATYVSAERPLLYRMP